MTSTRLAFDDDLLSDLTLKYHDETVRVHKVMLYRTSAWFRRKFELHANDEDSHTNFIELHDDEPEALRVVLERCYKDLDEDETSLLESCGHDFHYLMQVYLTALKYEVASVQTDALKAMTRLLDDTEPSSLAASQWYMALDTAFVDVSPAVAELHDYLAKKIKVLLPVMLSNEGGYNEFQRAVNGNSRLGALVIDIFREREASREGPQSSTASPV